MSSVWNNLENIFDLEAAIELSKSEKVLIVKHSTRCSISDMALNRLKKDEALLSSKFKLFYLDLLKFRNVSNAIAEILKVEHQSPQVVIVNNEKVVLTLNHNEIKVSEIVEIN